MQQLHLTQNMCLQGDPAAADFAAWRLQIGEGSTIEEGHSKEIEFPANMHVCSQAQLIEKVYPQLDIPGQATDEYLRDRTILAGQNDDVLVLNKNIMEKFSGQVKSYLSVDEVVEEAGVDNPETANLSVEYLQSLNSASLPVSKLDVKLGCPVMVLQNLSPSQGVCNGTRAVITHLGERVLELRLLTGTAAGQFN
ncbi:ATP-dependent DNA helicase PIF1 [Ceratobasidium sp. AG-Ba]|nr:ATP-dependent DNA helicase PIF1 [Ceratobasidium sp. AG-Ba]